MKRLYKTSKGITAKSDMLFAAAPSTAPPPVGLMHTEMAPWTARYENQFIIVLFPKAWFMADTY